MIDKTKDHASFDDNHKRGLLNTKYIL